jgi:L-lactate dehydrogenase complex protein LldG
MRGGRKRAFHCAVIGRTLVLDEHPPLAFRVWFVMIAADTDRWRSNPRRRLRRMGASSRAEFLDRVAAAVRAGNRHREPMGPDLAPSPAFTGSGADVVDRLAAELTAVGVAVERVADHAQLSRAVGDFARRFAIRRAICNTDPLLDETDIVAVLGGLGVEVFTARDLAALDEASRRERLFAADLGVAAPDWAIAETGSLVYAATADQMRSTSLLPPVHLGVVARSRVLSDLLELPDQLAGRSVGGVPPRNVAIVTGPSKTGDIELRLTTGVHGPGAVHVLILD